MFDSAGKGSGVTRARLLCSSLAPLIVILSIRVWDDSRLASGLLLCWALAALVSLVMLMHARSSLTPQHYVLERVRDESEQVPAYLVTYLLPFVTLNTAGWDDVGAYVIMGAVLVTLTVRTHLVYVQPVLLALGWHLYRTEVQAGLEEMIMLSRLRLRAGNIVTTVGVQGPVVRVESI